MRKKVGFIKFPIAPEAQACRQKFFSAYREIPVGYDNNLLIVKFPCVKNCFSFFWLFFSRKVLFQIRERLKTFWNKTILWKERKSQTEARIPKKNKFSNKSSFPQAENNICICKFIVQNNRKKSHQDFNLINLFLYS